MFFTPTAIFHYFASICALNFLRFSLLLSLKVIRAAVFKKYKVNRVFGDVLFTVSFLFFSIHLFDLLYFSQRETSAESEKKTAALNLHFVLP